MGTIYQAHQSDKSVQCHGAVEAPSERSTGGGALLL